MKKVILFTLAALFQNQICAQNLDSLNQEKYWSYRDRVLKFFTHVGDQRGESLIMDVIVRDLNCGDVKGDRLESGDVMAAHGLYLGVLATEYSLLQNTDDFAKLEACKNELYYAIKAIDRVDGFAETYFTDTLVTDTKGFFVRDDIPQNYYQFWEVTDSMPFHSSHTTNGFIADTFFTPTTDILCCGSEVWLHANETFAMKFTDHPDFQEAPWNGR